MKIFLLLLAILYLPVSTAMADEPMKVWNYADMSGIKLSFSKNNAAALRLNPDIKTPDGQNTLEVTLKEFGPDAVPWDIQLRFIYGGGLKAGHSYEINFLCKGSAPGSLRMVAAQAGSPWSVLPGSDSGVEISQDWQPVKLTFTVQKDWAEPLAMPRFMLAGYGAPSILYFGPLCLKEVPKLLPLSLNRDWNIFPGVTPPDSFVSIPGELAGPNGVVKAICVELKDNSLNLASLSGGGFKEKECAVLYNQFDSTESGRMRAGIAADWWLELYVNGEKVYSNIPAGNGAHSFTPDDHVVEFPVKAGRNVLAAKVLSGQGGWRFVCGIPSRAPDEHGIFTVRPGPDWKPVDMDKLIVKPGTALDFSSLNGERRPAGEFGRVIVNSAGRLAFEKSPEKPVRFLSVEFSLHAWRMKVHTWTKKDIEDLAGSIARQGYTMVRLQNNDRFLLGYKVHDRPLRTIAETGIPQNDEDIQFDAANYDRFDYFLACLKKNGVYANLDLMFAAQGYSMAYYAPDENTFRVQLFFNPEYRKHWEAVISHLLNHRNPYTGLCLKDDPAIANLEPYNEQDLLVYDRNHMKVFTPHFRKFLKEKYLTDEALKNAWGQPAISFATIPDINEDMLRKGDTKAGDAGGFLIKTMSGMNEWYYAVLRKNGYNGLLTQWDMIMRTMEVPVRAQMPVIAQHTYFAHPSLGTIPAKGLVKKSANWNYVAGSPNFDIMTRQDSSINSSYFRAAAAARFLDRPFIITEYSHSAFNRYRHERGLYFGSYAALQGWDSLAAHCGTCLAAVRDTTYEPFVCFENAIDPISRASEVVAALTWFRGDVKEAEHSVQLNLLDKTMFPKHLLAAIGDDYAKLAMLTKIGIAYPEVKPLSPVGRIKPDIELPMTEFSPLSVSQWFVSASSQDGNIFPSLLQKLKDERIITDSNRTDYSKRLFQSETGEINLNGKDETMTVITPRLEGAILKKNRPVKLLNMEIDSCSRAASVVVASLDRNKTTSDSKRLLLVFSTNALNSGMTFENSSMLLMVEVGSLPILMETARLSLKLKSAQSSAPVIYALNMDGTRTEQVPCEFKDGLLALSLDTARLKYATPYFEIVYQ